MSNDLTAPLTGVISCITNSRRFGVVTLDEPRSGLRHVVINDETKGRIALMNMSSDGSLPVGMRVIIEEAEQGSEGFRALKVAKA